MYIEPSVIGYKWRAGGRRDPAALILKGRDLERATTRVEVKGPHPIPFLAKGGSCLRTCQVSTGQGSA